MDAQMKKCPHCKQVVDREASRCPHCHGKIYRWSLGRKVIAGVFVLIVIIMITSAASSSQPKVSSLPVAQPSVRQISLTEVQCDQLKNEFYSFMTQENYNKTQLGKELLEQYAVNAGIPVEKSNPNVHYILPQSECGKNLDGALSVIVQGIKNGGGN